MKVIRIYLSLLLLFGFALMAFAQPGPGRGEGKRWMQDNDGPKGRYLNLPDLTDEQKEKISQFRTENMKVMLEKRNIVQEKMARLHTLQTAEKADMKAINSLIDEVSQIKADMAKQRAAHHQKIRSILSDEQRVIFDSRPQMGHQGGFGQGHFGKKGRGEGNCRYAD
jgi:Spy/CpxP family protein refolding chaperone